MAEAVIGRAALRILQRLVGFVDFLETLLRGGIAIARIGMAFLGETAESGLDLAVTRVASYAQDVVVAPFCHSTPLRTLAAAVLPKAAHKPLVGRMGALCRELLASFVKPTSCCRRP